jgi:hypothetical protein
MKVCSTCDVEKELIYFSGNKDGKFGVRASCKECERVKIKHTKFDIPTEGIYKCCKCQCEKDVSNFYRDIYKKRGLRPYCKACDLDNRRIFIENNPGIEAARSKKRREDPSNKIRMNLGTRLWQVVSKKHGNTMHLVGCSTEDLMKHLESKFTSGMNWDNYGTWHVDHIRPCCSFNLENPADQLKCFHWTNLQPLWAADNISKGGKMTL